MSFDFENAIPADSYKGKIDGITVIWVPLGITNLPGNATTYKVPIKAIKRVTENVAVACARRLGRTSVRILGSFHETTIDTITRQTTEDPCHCSLAVKPGGAKVHVYVTRPKKGSFAGVRVLGESIVQRGTNFRDPTLSFGTLPAGKTRL